MNLTTTALLAVRLSLLRWFAPNLLLVGACGPNLPSGASLGLRTMYLPTLVSPMSMSSFRSPPWMPGVLQSEFSTLILRISSRVSFETGGRPGYPQWTFHVPNRRNPCAHRPMVTCQSRPHGGHCEGPRR